MTLTHLGHNQNSALFRIFFKKGVMKVRSTVALLYKPSNHTAGSLMGHFWPEYIYIIMWKNFMLFCLENMFGIYCKLLHDTDSNTTQKTLLSPRWLSWCWNASLIQAMPISAQLLNFLQLGSASASSQWTPLPQLTSPKRPWGPGAFREWDTEVIWISML